VFHIVPFFTNKQVHSSRLGYASTSSDAFSVLFISIPRALRRYFGKVHLPLLSTRIHLRGNACMFLVYRIWVKGISVFLFEEKRGVSHLVRWWLRFLCCICNKFFSFNSYVYL